MEDQQKAEQQKTESKTVREKLKVQNEAVAGRTEQVMKDLAEVEPAVRDAENGEYQTNYIEPYNRGLEYCLTNWIIFIILYVFKMSFKYTITNNAN